MTKARDLANASTALSAVSATELGYLDGVTSAVQTQLNAKQPTVTNVSDTEIGYLDGVTSAIQTQLDAKLATATAASTYQPIVSGVDNTEIGYLNGVTSAIQTQLNAKQSIVSGVSDTEISYLDGVTSAIQTQLNAKAPTATPTFTGNVTAGSGRILAISTPTVASGGDWANSLVEVQGTSGAANNPGIAWHAPGASAATIFHPRSTQALQIGGNGGTVDTSVKSIRNIFMSTSDPSGGVDGDVWIKYTP